MARGLAGEARGRDNKVTLGELVEYLGDNVPQWATNHRDDLQVPQLMPPLAPEADFPLVFAGKRSAAEGRDAAQDRSRQDRLAQRLADTGRLWIDLAETAARRQAVRTDPAALAGVQHGLLRVEQLALAGRVYDTEFETLRDRVAGAIRDLGVARRPAAPPVFSLPLARQCGPAAATAAEVEQLLAAWKAAGGRPQAKDGQPPPPKPRSYAVAAEAGLRWLVESGAPQRAQLSDVLAAVAAARAAGTSPAERWQGPDALEVQLLRILDRDLDWEAGPPWADRLRKAAGGALRVQIQAEQAAAPDDVRTHYWAQPLVDAADLQRRAVLDGLLVGDAANLERVEGILGGPGLYATAERRAAEVAAVLELRDRAYAQIPDLAAWLIAQGRQRGSSAVGPPAAAAAQGAAAGETGTWAAIAAGGDPLAEDLGRLSGLLHGLHQLAAELDAGLSRGAAWPLPGLDELQQRVARPLDEIHRGYQDHCEQLKEGPEDKATLRQILLALQTPWIAADRRQALLEKLGANHVPARGAGRPRPIGCVAGNRLGRLGRRGRAIAAILRRGWQPARSIPLWKCWIDPGCQLLPEAYQPASLTRPAAAGESDLAWLARQGGEVRRRLTDLPEALKALEDEAHSRLGEATETPANTRIWLSAADRLARAAAPLAAAPVEAGSAEPAAPAAAELERRQDPTRRLADVDRHFQFLWHAHRALTDGWGSAGSGSEVVYFADVGTRYVDAAGQLEATPRRWQHGGTDLKAAIKNRQAACQANPAEVSEARTLGGTDAAPHQVQIHWRDDLPPEWPPCSCRRPRTPAARAAWCP